jgi:alpha-tubulin suppressor-like RCC1 family protein
MLAAFTAIPAFAATYTVMSWGENDDGELGNGALTTTGFDGIAAPGPVSGLSGVMAIAGGKVTSLALTSDGNVWVWGFVNSTASYSDVPVQQSGISGVVAISQGWLHSLVLKNDGTVWGWGDNSGGELGITGFPNGQPHPVQVVGISDVVAIAAGYNYSLALKSDGTVWAWGSQVYGELGTGASSGNPNTTPTQVVGLSGVVVAIAAGYANHSLAVQSDGTVWAWGNNAYGELGNGTINNSNVPIQVPGLSGMIAVAAGYEFSLALKNDGTVWAWGLNAYGALGTATTTNHSAVPLQAAISGVVAVSAGTHSLALRNDGTVWAWGYNQYGELGNGTNSGAGANPSPAPVSGLSGVGAISAGENYSLAIVPNVGAAGQTITFGALSPESLGASPFTVNASASSGLTVAFASNNPAVCTVSGGAVTVVADGTCLITASQPGNAIYAAAPPVTQTLTVGATTPAAFFTGEIPLGSGVYYLQFPDGNLFGYYNFASSSVIYHYDMGFEAFIPGSAADIYLYDFTSNHWWYTSATLFPYLYDFSLNSWIYYFPSTTNTGHYTTNPRYFSNLTTGMIITM